MILNILRRAALAGGLATSAVLISQSLGENEGPFTYLTFLRAKETKVTDVLVIGGGVVGLACARECAVRGKSVLLLEKEGCVAAGATSGNSGIGCTGYDAPRGSLESRLLRRSIQRHQNLYRLSYEHVRKCGSLVVAWTEKEVDSLQDVLQDNIDAGDTEARILSQDELRDMEPALSTKALGAVYCPREAVVEPWLVPIGYAQSAIIHGAKIKLNTQVLNAIFDPEEKLWTVFTKKNKEAVPSGRSHDGEILVRKPSSIEETEGQSLKVFKAGLIINCAGLHGDTVEAIRTVNQSEVEKPDFKVTPRKGQSIVYEMRESDEDCAPHMIIEPVPGQFTKGVIVWTTVYGNVIVGPTAVDQESRTDRSTDQQTIKKLKEWGEGVIPGLNNAKVIGTYSGLRPSTQHRDYQIRSHPSSRWITVGGIRSTGYTGSSGIAEYVADLVEQVDGASKPSINQGSALLGVTESANSADPLSHPRNQVEVKSNGPVPSLADLADNYRQRGDGKVEIYGKAWHVTHPASTFGMETLKQ